MKMNESEIKKLIKATKNKINKNYIIIIIYFIWVYLN